MGRCLDLDALPLRDLVKLLLVGQVIRTYAHAEARVTRVREAEGGAQYSAEFDAVHTYYTNRRNEDAYAFRVTVERSTGEIAVEGR